MSLSYEIVERDCRPLEWLRAVAAEPFPVLLESSQTATPLGRCSLLCWDPFARVTCRGRVTEVADLRTGAAAVHSGDPFRVLAEAFDRFRVAAPADYDLPFAGGAVGYFSYDLKNRIELLERRCEVDVAVPVYTLCFYAGALVFDHAEGVTWRVEAGHGGEAPLPEPVADTGVPAVGPVRLASNFTRSGYLAAVGRVKEYIAAGDIYQANLSQRFAGDCLADGLSIYERLRAVNPAPFGAYLGYPEFEIISSSPERFLLLEGETVTTRPIKGTRPRREGRAESNRRMAADLLASEKDHAELAMIVDLERNDLGRVCDYGTVRVVEHAAIEEYPTVYHLVSTVTGRLRRPQQDEFDLIRAAFPGGSITGAPKVRAMEIIEELEPHARNVYTGAIGYVSFHGRMDLNIAIRTMVRAGGRVYFSVGGGIVADSDPVLEYEETLHKGRALFEALGSDSWDRLMEGADHG